MEDLNTKIKDTKVKEWPINYDDAHDPKYGEPYTVRIVKASAETLKGFGTIVTDFNATEVEITPWPTTGRRKLCEGTGTFGGVSEGDFVHEWVGDKIRSYNLACGWSLTSGRLPAAMPHDKRTNVLVREANYHPDGGQVFFSANGEPFVALLALPGDDVKPEDFVAFYFDGSFGVQIHANIWHQPMYPINDKTTFKNKQGRVHACVGIDFPDEFGKYLSVPLECSA